MPELQLLVDYGYLILLLWVFGDQAGLPIPALPVLFGAGMLAGTGSLDIVAVLLIATAAAMAADLAWYAIGRYRGKPVLKMLCRLSLEPDFCVRQTGAAFQRYGPITVVVSNFIPAMQTIVPPLAGVVGFPFAPFTALRFAGTVLWVGVFVIPGYLLADEAMAFLTRSTDVMVGVAATVALALAAFVVYKFIRRHTFLRAVREDTVHPHELHTELTAADASNRPHVVDLRDLGEIHEFPHVIPGATVIPLEHIDDHVAVLAQKRDVILYCT